MKIRHFTTLTFLFLFSISLQAQLPPGSIGADFTVTDINNNSHNLYDILDQGKSVILDFSATWCGPCWNYHQTHRLQDLYAEYGPNGTDEIEIFMLEASYSTNTNCIYGPSGCNSSTYGNWTAGVDYPIVNLTSSNGGNVNSNYALAYYPTLYMICPGRKVYEVGQTSYQGWVNRITSCSLESSGEVTNEICYNDGNDEVDLTTNGGYGNVTYSWSNGQTTEDISGFGPGDYTCTITDGYSHSIEVGPFSVDGPSSALIANIANQGNVDCNGNNNGFVNINVFGGEPNYQYLWSNNETTEDINNVAGGTYTVTVTDDLGCTKTLVSNVSEPPAITLIAVALDENCGQQDGLITLTAGGGTGSFMYDIGNGPTPNNIFTNLSAGAYNVSVTDGNSCVEVALTVVAAAAAPTADAGNNESVSCDLYIIELDGTGSSSGNNISYTWTTNDGNIVSGGATQTPTIDEPGTYSISVLNFMTGCESFDEVVVEGSVEAPVADAGNDDELNCAISTVTLDGSNSSSGDNIAYEWLNENDDVISTDSIIDVDFPGVYRLVVLNTENNCSRIDSVVIAEDITVPVANAGNDDELNCVISTVTLDGSGSSSGDEFSYEWQNSNGNTIGTTMAIDVSTEDVYTLIVYNAINGCSSESNATVTASTEFPDAVVNGDDELTCVNTEATLDGSQSSNGDDFSYEWVNSNNEVIGTGINIVVNESDTYTFVVSDNSNGCTASTDFIVDNNTQSPEVNVEDPQDLNCIIQTVTLDASNTIGDNLSFEWFDENGNTIGNTPNIDVTNPGNYNINVIDNLNGCEASDQTTIGINVEAPIAEAQPVGVLDCANFSTLIDGSNSSSGANFVYEWTTIDGCILAGGNEQISEVDCAGSYTLIVTNLENGCTSSVETIVESTAELPDADAGEAAALHCNLSSLELDGSNSASGAEYSYSWTTDDGNILEGENSLTPTVDAPGIYTIVVLNNDNGCSQSSDVEITNIPDVEVTFINPLDVTCFGGTNGSAIADVFGGLAPYNYEWSTGATSDYIEDLPAGSYFVTVADTNDCIAVSEIAISEPDQIDLTIDQIINENEEDLNGSVEITVVGGVQPYSYEWTINGQLISTEEDLVDVEAGEYQVIITDTNGCFISSETLVIDRITAIIDPVLAKYISVLPNPTAGSLYIQIDLPESRFINLSILSITGQEVLRAEEENIATKEYELDLSKFTDGIYLLKVSTEDGIYTQKIVLEKY